MPFFKTTEPKILKEHHTITVKLCDVEGYDCPVIIIENKSAVPTPKVIDELLAAATLLEQMEIKDN